jgi:hypothetical protein
MKLKQHILAFTVIGLIAISLVACAGVVVSAPEPQQVAAVVPAQPTAPQAQPAVVVEPAQSANPAVVETQEEVEPLVSTTFVNWVLDTPLRVDTPEGPVVKEAESTLVRMEHGLYATFSAVELEPGDAFTMWWVIFNQPENCTDSKCGFDDVFSFDEMGDVIKTEVGARQWNFPAHAITGFALGRASGSVVDTNGTAEFRAHLPVGDAHEFDFGPGLLNPLTAEVHLIIRTHSQMIPGLLHEQLNTPWGGCPEGWPKDPCKDVQVAIRLPSEQ